MSHTTTAIAGGTTGALPDANVAIDRNGSADYQRLKLADATEGSTTPIGTDANPLRVRNRRRGTSDYDSGRVAVGATLAAITTATVYPEVILVTNTSVTQRWVTLTNTAGDEWISQYPVAPRQTVTFHLSPLELVGLKAQAEAAGAIVIAIAGGQA